MLLNLHVKNMALIDEIDVNFEKGLNILTGETGAGKSIIIGSINTALGAKVSKDVVGSKGDYALVELVFSVENEKQRMMLKEKDIQAEDDQVIISRRIKDGRSAAKVNGELVPLSVIRNIAGIFIDIYGQHEHQSLLDRKKHMQILDEYGKVELAPLKVKTKHLYQEITELKKEWENASITENEKERRLSFLNFEIEEIEESALTEGEDEELEARFRRLSNGRRIMEAINAVKRITGYEEVNSAGDGIGRALHELTAVEEFDRELGSLVSQLTDIDGLLNDFNRELSAYIEEYIFSEEEFGQIQERLDLINRLKSKYGKNISDILSYKEDKEKEMQQLLDYERYISGLREKINVKETQILQLCEKISIIRKKRAEIMTEQIRGALRDLNFIEVRFTMEFSQLEAYTPSGYDDAGFMIAANPGEPLRPLDQIASGGELSRIMLAIKSVLADKDDIDTLIFDEIDTGISGRTAQMVSEKMAGIAASHQVICITHLPQIAAMADSHYLIDKRAKGEKTITVIQKLDEKEITMELARILGGAQITDAVVESAREMKILAEKEKLYLKLGKTEKIQ